MGLFDLISSAPSKGRRKRFNKRRAVIVICGRIAASDIPCDDICRAKSYLPAWRTVESWIAADPALQHLYAHAKSQQADYLARRIIPISQDTTLHPLIQKNQIEANKWVAAKLAPQVYGDKLDISGAVTMQHDDVTSLQTALALHHILQQIQARRDGGQLIDVTPVSVTRLVD